MTWGKSDIRDQWIADLREQCAAKDLQIADLHRQLIALVKPGAYRQVYGEPQDKEVVTLGQQPILSPSAIPAFQITDEKWADQVIDRMNKKLEQQ